MSREDLVSGKFFLTIDQHFNWRSMRGMKTTGMVFEFLIERELNPTEIESLERNINHFEPGKKGKYRCRMDMPVGTYWFDILVKVDSGIERGWAVFNGAGVEEKEVLPENAPVPDRTPLLYVSDNCYNPETHESPAASPPIARNGKITVEFSRDIYPVNFNNVRIFRGTTSVNHEITSNGETRMSNFEVPAKIKVQKKVLEISPRYGEFEPGSYFYAIGPDALRDSSGALYEGRNNMFNVV